MSQESSPQKKSIPIRMVVWVIIWISIYFFLSPDKFAKPNHLVEAMIESGQVEVLTILPQNLDPSQLNLDEYTEKFHGYLVLSSVIVDDAETIKTLLTGLIPEEDREPPMCFNPRHVVKSVENPDNYLVICFECSQISYSYGSKGGHIPLNHNDGINKAAFDDLVEQFGMITEADILKATEAEEDATNIEPESEP